MILTKKQALIIGGVLLFTLLLLLINIVVPFPGRKVEPPALDKLKITSAKLHGTEAKRHLEIVTNQPIKGDTSFKAIFGTKTGYMEEVTGFLTTSDKQIGPTFLINIMELPRFDQAEKRKKIEEHVKAGNIQWVDITIYDRGEFLFDADVFQDSRKITQARFDDL